MRATGRRDLARDGIGAVAVSALSFPLSVAVTVLIARTLGPAGKGVVDVAIGSVTAAAIALNLSLPAGISYATARAGGVDRRLAATAMATCAAAALIAAIAAATWFALAPPVAGWGPGWAAIGAGLGVGLLTAHASLRAYLAGLQRFTRLNASDIALKLATCALVVGVAAAGTDQAVLGMLLAHAVAVAAALALVALQVARPPPPPAPPADDRSPGAILGYALSCHAANIAQQLTLRADLFILAAAISAAAAGIYAAAVTLMQVAWLAPAALSGLLLPSVAAGDDPAEIAAGRTALVARVALGLGVAWCAIAAAVAGPLMGALLGPGFERGWWAAVALAPGVAARTLTIVLGSHLAGTGRPDINRRIAIGALVICLGLDLVLIPDGLAGWGMVGAGIATSCAYLAAAVASVRAFCHREGISAAAVVIPRPGDLPHCVGKLAARVGRDR